jgi:hypothetical protein
MPANDYYVATGTPGTGAAGASAPIRSEYSLIEAGFAKLPALSGLAAGTAVIVNPSGTGLTNTVGALLLAGNLTTTGAHNTTLIQQADVTLTLPAASGTLATLAGAETLSNKTLVAPELGTPASGSLANCTDLPAAAIAAGTMASGMTLVAPELGTVASGNIADCTGWVTGSNGQTFLGSDVALNNTGTPFDVVNTGSIGAAGWVVEIEICGAFTNTSQAGVFDFGIFNGTSYIIADRTGTSGINLRTTGTISRIVTLSAATTFTFRAQDVTSTTSIVATSAGSPFSLANKATYIKWTRLA